MKHRKFKTNQDELLRQGREIMSENDDSIYHFRVFCALLAIIGVPAKTLAQAANVTRGSITNWVRSADENGFESLKNKPKSGRPSKLTSEQKAEIDKILQDDPEKYGFKVWDGISVSALIMDRFGIAYTVRSSQRLFHELGYGRIRPRCFPSKGYEQTEERQEFKKKIEKIQSNPKYTIIYQDEVHFSIQTGITAGWYKKGSRPTVKSFPGRDKLSYSGFVNPATGQLVVAKPERFNYATTIEAIQYFIERCPPLNGTKHVIVMDNAPWHKKAYRLIVDEEQEEYADIRKYATILLLPPYSPDLNPIERVWRITRRENTHNRFFASILSIEERLDNAFATFGKPNSKLQRLCSGM